MTDLGITRVFLIPKSCRVCNINPGAVNSPGNQEMLAQGKVVGRGGRGVLVRVGDKLFEMGYGAYLVWKAFEEESTPEEVVAQAVAITGMKREEVEALILPFVENMERLGLIK